MLMLGLPGELYGMFAPQYPYEFGEITCKLRAFLIEFTSYASILTITCFSIERWLAICFPLRIHLFSTVKRASKVIICVWICAFLAALPVVFLVVVNAVPVPDWANGISDISIDGKTIINTEFCGLDTTRLIEQKRLFYSSFTFFFLLPALLISFVYCHIVIKLRSANDYLSSQNAQTKSAAKSRKGILRILVAVVITFFLCWFPFHIQRLMTVFLNESPQSTEIHQNFIFLIYSLTFYISGYCYYSNSALNPILYNILSKKYRIAFCRTIFGEKVANRILYRLTKCRTPCTNSCISRVPSKNNESCGRVISVKETQQGIITLIHPTTIENTGFKDFNVCGKNDRCETLLNNSA
uniref:G-protein coupled receptors family 1 profile domain-containing protein n=1 Tax=Panagrolaimus superbus TaxID=310955 RepID=A0A914Z3I2_9BILA